MSAWMSVDGLASDKVRIQSWTSPGTWDKGPAIGQVIL
jgi:hypothetical protein